MAKYGIGARVRDDGGDEGVIVDKAKGLRFVKYDEPQYGKLWQPKDNLTALPANDNICPETSETAYTGGDVAQVSAWVPLKTGDRVRYIGGRGLAANAGAIATITAAFDGEYERVEWLRDGNDNGQSDGAYCPGNFEPAPLTIESGKFYRTRDGRKVGPMEVTEIPWTDTHGDTSAFGGRLDGHKDHYTANGLWLTRYGEDRPEDLVAEWVEPAILTPNQVRAADDLPPVAVAEATATPAYTVGQKVRCVEDYPGAFTVGKEYIIAYYDPHGVPRIGVTKADHGGANGISARHFEPVTPEPAGPPAKFKVGDRVVSVNDSDGSCIVMGNTYTVTAAYPDGYIEFDDEDGDNRYRDGAEYALAPSIPVGATVTFTATGRLSAYTTDGHAQVVFPGLTPGQNSFALPAKFVALAN